MGIPFYFASIVQKYPGIVQGSPPQQGSSGGCDYLFLDFNGAIHPAARNVLDKWDAEGRHEEVSTVEGQHRIEEEMCAAIWDYLITLVNMSVPKKGIHICMDGVAPRAKMMQQRKRRYLTKLRFKMEKKTQIWDTNAISPGTTFMTKLHAYLRNRIRDSIWAAPVSFSDSTEPGEGEHKMFEMLQRTSDVDPIVYIYGLDADLIMLSLLSHTNNLYLMREDTMAKKNGTGAGSVGDTPFIYLNVSGLRKGILMQLVQEKWLTDTEAENIFSQKAVEVIESYVVMCFLLGNDFIPNVPSLVLKKKGIDIALKAYSDMYANTGGHLVGLLPSPPDTPPRVGIHLYCLEMLIREIGKGENDQFWLINKDYLMRKANSTNNPENDRIEFYPMVPENKHPLAKDIYNSQSTGHGAPSWRSLYYKHLFNTKSQDDKTVVRACDEYIKGVMWTYQYYKRRPKDDEWYYPYNYAPSSYDLANHTVGNTAALDKWLNVKRPHLSTPTDPRLQLLCILPKSSVGLLPKNIQKIMTDDKTGCSYMYPTDYSIVTYLKTHLWECNPALPSLDIRMLESALGECQ